MGNGLLLSILLSNIKEFERTLLGLSILYTSTQDMIVSVFSNPGQLGHCFHFYKKCCSTLLYFFFKSIARIVIKYSFVDISRIHWLIKYMFSWLLKQNLPSRESFEMEKPSFCILNKIWNKMCCVIYIFILTTQTIRFICFTNKHTVPAKRTASYARF